MTPDQAARDRTAVARIAAHTSWAKTPDRAARLAPAMAASRERFARQVDPDGTMDPVEREKRAEAARLAFYQRMARKSAAVRRRNAAAAAELAALREGRGA